MTCRFESCQAHEKKGKTTDDMNPFSRIIHWYFSRKALPYWSVLIFDSVVLFLSGFFAYWLFHRGYATQQHSYQIGKVMLIYIALSWIPMRIFSTYSGIIRYSSFVDLRRLTFANFTSLCIAWAVHYPIYLTPPTLFEHFSTRLLVVIYAIATVLMYLSRVIIKTLFDITKNNNKAIPVLIYGTMSGGVALAKFIRSQDPIRFVLKGFITHDPHHARPARQPRSADG